MSTSSTSCIPLSLRGSTATASSATASWSSPLPQPPPAPKPAHRATPQRPPSPCTARPMARSRAALFFLPASISAFVVLFHLRLVLVLVLRHLTCSSSSECTTEGCSVVVVKFIAIPMRGVNLCGAPKIVVDVGGLLCPLCFRWSGIDRRCRCWWLTSAQTS